MNEPDALFAYTLTHTNTHTHTQEERNLLQCVCFHQEQPAPFLLTLCSYFTTCGCLQFFCLLRYTHIPRLCDFSIISALYFLAFLSVLFKSLILLWNTLCVWTVHLFHFHLYPPLTSYSHPHMQTHSAAASFFPTQYTMWKSTQIHMYNEALSFPHCLSLSHTHTHTYTQTQHPSTSPLNTLDSLSHLRFSLLQLSAFLPHLHLTPRLPQVVNLAISVCACECVCMCTCVSCNCRHRPSSSFFYQRAVGGMK